MGARKESYTKAAITASNDITYEIYQKDFSKRATVTLGGNGTSTGVILYNAFVAEKGKISFSTAKYGDIYVYTAQLM